MIENKDKYYRLLLFTRSLVAIGMLGRWIRGERALELGYIMILSMLFERLLHGNPYDKKWYKLFFLVLMGVIFVLMIIELFFPES